ncbi:MAG: serine/threonine protein kinase [Aridibacter sp.]
MLTQGETLRGRYKIIRRLGQGGMGAVYEAHDNVFDTSVALKEVILDLSSAHNTLAQEMAQHAFEREAKLLAKINHETIPHVKDYFTEAESQFLVMELVDGDDLAKLLQERGSPFDVDTLIGWTDKLLEALDYLHSQNPPIIHRDIKPQNLKLTTRKKIKLLDFGIAKGSESKAANTIANQTFIAATLNYSPIEQMLRVLDPTFLAVITHKYSEKIEEILEQNADITSDLYALGATLYHLATNVSPVEAIKRSINSWDGKPNPLENPSKLNPEIPNEFSQFLLKSMEIKRENRYGSAAEMSAALHKMANFGTNPSMIPTVELNIDHFKTQDESAEAEKMSAKTFVLENPPNMGGASSGTTDASNATANLSPDPNPSNEIITEVAPPRAAPPTPHQQTGQQFNPQIVALKNSQERQQTANQAQQPIPTTKKKSGLKFLLLIPVFGLLLLLFGGAAGAFYYFNYVAVDDKPVANTNQNTEVVDEKPVEKSIESDKPIEQNEVFDENSNIEIEKDTNSNNSSKTTKTETTKTPVTRTTPATKTTPKPTIRKTPVPRRTPLTKPPTPKPTLRKTPVPRKTPKNMNCIYTDDC